MNDEDDSNDGDYVTGEEGGDYRDRRYPIHDCVEIESAEALRDLLYVEVEDEEEKSGHHLAESSGGKRDDASSSDDIDSAAEAQAAAVGLSPGPAASEPQTKKAFPVQEGIEDTSNGPQPMEVDEKTPASTPVENGGGNDKQDEEPKEEKSSHATSKKLEVNTDLFLNEKDEDENTALHVAILHRKLEHVKILLDAGASFRIKCDGSWPLHTAISMGGVAEHRQFAYECVVALVEKGADLSIKDDSLQTPLFLSCMFNAPQITSYILSKDDGAATLNTKADKTANRALHAAAKYDTVDNASLSRNAVAIATGQLASPILTSTQPNQSGKSLESMTGGKTAQVSGVTPSEALMTHVLLGTAGIDVDAINTMGRSPLHIACAKGNWSVARLLLQAGASTTLQDRRKLTPGQLAYKRGMPIPQDLVTVLGEVPDGTSVRDLVVDPHGTTMIICHELCLLHRTCPPIRRSEPDPPPENVRRLQVLVDPSTGILRTGEFANVLWKNEARRAAMTDVLKVHDYTYVQNICRLTLSIPDHPMAIAHLDADTTLSRWSFEAAMRAAGSVCEAVDKVVSGEHRNIFCAVRPPGHHAGPRGIVRCANDTEGSHGFCLLNNVAIGAAYARSMYRNEGIKKVAIIDFDVHHGNGTEEIIRHLVPNTETHTFRTPYSVGEMTTQTYRPWLDETDVKNVFFSSTHGYGNRGLEQSGWFYPASGKTHTSDALKHPAMVEQPSIDEFVLSQTWARIGRESKTNCCKVINIGMGLPDGDGDAQSKSMRQRLELRDAYRKEILPHLRNFDPDLIFISAGFDAHRKDTMNFGYVGMVEEDYEWVTEQLVKVANSCCNGRIVSVLEGGYKIHGGIVSPFARSVASHVRALVDGGKSRAQFDLQDCEWESQLERSMFERREKKKEQEREKLAAERRSYLEQLSGSGTGDVPEDPDAPTRKRRRNQVDYQELFKQMQQEGFAS